MNTPFKKHEITVVAPQNLIWWVISDFSQFYLWNSVVPYGSGSLKPGRTLRVSLRMTSGKVSLSSCFVNKVERNHFFVLSRRLLSKRLLYLEHAFIIEPINEPENEFKFTQTLKAEGILCPFFIRRLRAQWELFNVMNHDLKYYINKLQNHGT
ncbi:hypothetical protein [Ekhidna sp.]|uniref:hypothetical protein n=1 Tax=Ekhidna sp. TaxID=2608089 RepID=UPI0032983D6A